MPAEKKPQADSMKTALTLSKPKDSWLTQPAWKDGPARWKAVAVGVGVPAGVGVLATLAWYLFRKR